MNKVILIGFVGNTPSQKTFDNAKAKTTFSLATTEYFAKTKSVSWHQIAAWNSLGKIAMDLLSKGSHVCIEGKINYREFDKDGIMTIYTEIVADSVEVLNKVASKATETVAESTVEEPKKPTSKKGKKVAAAKTGDLPF
jgi:single-strand DNA-binding protein